MNRRLNRTGIIPYKNLKHYFRYGNTIDDFMGNDGGTQSQNLGWSDGIYEGNSGSLYLTHNRALDIINSQYVYFTDGINDESFSLTMVFVGENIGIVEPDGTYIKVLSCKIRSFSALGWNFYIDKKDGNDILAFRCYDNDQFLLGNPSFKTMYGTVPVLNNQTNLVTISYDSDSDVFTLFRNLEYEPVTVEIVGDYGAMRPFGVGFNRVYVGYFLAKPDYYFFLGKRAHYGIWDKTLTDKEVLAVHKKIINGNYLV